MSYTKGLKPAEYASHSSQTPLILDKDINEFLKDCYYPKHANEELKNEMNIQKIQTPKNNPIKKILAIDGGYNEIMIGQSYPSSTMAFFRYGVNYFQLDDLKKLQNQKFIGKTDIGKLHNIDSYNFTIPTKNIIYKKQKNLKNSIRHSLYEHFMKTKTQKTLMETLSWLIFREYKPQSKTKYHLKNCPNCGRPVKIEKYQMKDYTTECPHCMDKIYLTDVFRINELVIDNAAQGITSYIMNLLEQFILINYIHFLQESAPTLLKESLFIKDGPLAFFGVTNKISTPMRELIYYLEKRYNLYLVGVEKSGEFMEHAQEINHLLEPGEYIIPNSKYIYKYIIFGQENPNQPYGSSTYYSNKIIYKSKTNRIFVLNLPNSFRLNNPHKENFKNIDIILENLDELKNDRFDNALLPINSINQNVCISESVSGTILKQHTENSLS